ncbi:signal transduction histidine kinase [Litoreibacter meonggei]|uniref:histidine kinase n=1 Tax=Litoreibacter meonggei TaxID=1049199 RepID=A0A497WUM9_9RHOB|nr:ATP-binding protein [Litoreibacter meonggei]RLJ59547.1 signal transduction histidine kinase [Litoreibacter meonggei]
MHAVKVPKKWRPSLAMLIALVVGVLVLLPFVALTAARITSNQFVRETEANLHAQAAIYSAIYAQEFLALLPEPSFGAVLAPEQIERLQETWHPVDAVLVSGSRSILPPRPDPLPTALMPEDVYLALSADLSRLAKKAQKSTLVGFLALDHQGQVIAGSGTDTGSFSHVAEVARALKGEIVSAARWREEEYRRHSLRSVSRDTKFRVYVAHPVNVAGKVIGVVYLSRTPSNLNKYLLQQKNALLWLLATVAVSAAVIGFSVWRFLTRPLTQLQDQARHIAKGELGTSLPSYGLKELASLGQSLMDMGNALRAKSAALNTYTKHATHELKSPVTSIAGAAELLQGSNVTDDRRNALAATISKDATRMDRLLMRMRDMARGQAEFGTQPTRLSEIAARLTKRFEGLVIEANGARDALLPLPEEAAEICLTHILQNAQEHGATRVVVDFDDKTSEIRVQDNGTGISEANIHKIVGPFFTTKREQGGTGMGLSISAEILAQFGGRIDASNTASGALIVLSFKDDASR